MKFKRIIVVVSAIFAVTSAFAQETYETLLKKAKDYEAKKQWVHALGAYWDAMEAEPTEKAAEACEAFTKLSETIWEGNPGYGEFDEFSLYDGWFALCKEYEKYWTDNCPYNFEFSALEKGDLDMATRTATYTVNANIFANNKYWNIKERVGAWEPHTEDFCGFKSVWRSDWTGLSEYWPKNSIFDKPNAEKEKQFLKDGIALVYCESDYIDEYFIKPAFFWHNDWDGEFLAYDVKLNIINDDGKVLLTSERFAANSTYVFKGVSQDIMRIIDSGKYKIILAGAWLKYGGNASKNEYTNAIQFNTGKIKFRSIRPGTSDEYIWGNGIQDIDAIEEVQKLINAQKAAAEKAQKEADAAAKKAKAEKDRARQTAEIQAIAKSDMFAGMSKKGVKTVQKVIKNLGFASEAQARFLHSKGETTFKMFDGRDEASIDAELRSWKRVEMKAGRWK